MYKLCNCNDNIFFHAWRYNNLQAAPVNIIVGSHVWVDDPKLAWLDGEVIKINGQEVHVRTSHGKTVSTTYFTSPYHIDTSNAHFQQDVLS